MKKLAVLAVVVVGFILASFGFTLPTEMWAQNTPRLPSNLSRACFAYYFQVHDHLTVSLDDRDQCA